MIYTAEVLERARVLMARVEEEGGSQQAAFVTASATYEDARHSWRQGTYREALSQAEVSRGLLVSILDSIRNPSREGEARFIYVEGEVELRRGETGAFRQARARDALYEGDYVRSSNAGSAEILFGRDGALFTIRPGTLLKINRTRESSGKPQSVGIRYGWVDLSTSMLEGEVETEFAQLTVAQQSAASVGHDRATAVESFSVGRGTAKLASAETGEIVEMAELQQVLHQDGGLTRPILLPAAPRIKSPADNFGINLDRRKEIELSWSEVEEADGGYALQISRSRLFAGNVIDVDGRVKNSARLGVLGEGNFYWRVAADDGKKGRSPWSPAQRFRVASLGGIYWEDTVPPQLELREVYANGNILIVTGRTEPGVVLEIDGQPISINADGSFYGSITHSESGLVRLEVTAIDASGNQTVKRREVLIEAL
ncbi:MAG: hypothetical protein IH936_16705 [Acidobacteria bacterium]|nr:hypothetical protein [Acidobacteriota bacterium]